MGTGDAGHITSASSSGKATGELKSDVFQDENGNDVTVEIASGVTRVTGEVTYQVEMNIPREGRVHASQEGGKVPTVCIRGPSRVDRGMAEEDARKMKAAHLEGGIKQVRKVRAALTGRGGYDLGQ